VFWAQATTSFLIWIGLGAWMMRRSTDLRQHAFSMAKGRRALLATASFIGGPAVLFATLWGATVFHGFGASSMNPFVWLLITIAGVVCVGSIAIGFGYLVSLAMEAAAQERVTEKQAAASTNQVTSET
jgi:hypothetical protein